MKSMPVVFIGHGSPMNAIQKNAFTEELRSFSSQTPKPRAILCVSARWETQGTQVSTISFSPIPNVFLRPTMETSMGQFLPLHL